MPRFRFNLQAVLDQREMVEQQRQKEVARLQAERLAIESRIRGALERAAAEQDESRSLALRGDVLGVRRQAAAVARCRAEAARDRLSLAAAVGALEAAQAALREAVARRKSVELLKERRRAEWLRALDKREQAELDDLAAMGATAGVVMGAGDGARERDR